MVFNVTKINQLNVAKSDVFNVAKPEPSNVAETELFNVTKIEFFNVAKVEFEQRICRKFWIFQLSARDKKRNIENRKFYSELINVSVMPGRTK